MSEHHCPSCGVSLEGDLIYDTFFNIAGDHEAALKAASYYGATQTSGRWGKAIGIYCIHTDRTLHYKCPSCGHRWCADS